MAPKSNPEAARLNAHRIVDSYGNAPGTNLARWALEQAAEVAELRAALESCVSAAEGYNNGEQCLLCGHVKTRGDHSPACVFGRARALLPRTKETTDAPE